MIPGYIYYLGLYSAGSCVSNLGDFEAFDKALLDAKTALFKLADTLKEFLTSTNVFEDSDIS